MTWGDYVERWVAEHGSWVALADTLIHRARPAIEIADDPLTVERGLRRLARRHHKPGGQYGRWMLRYFGVTRSVEQWLRWLGAYHTRFTDLPSSLRLEQLALWNRPPIAESALACWIHLGLAHAHHSRLELARAAAEAAGDGGLVRMRVMALNMLSRVAPQAEAADVHARARAMATALEDEELLRRVGHCVPAIREA